MSHHREPKIRLIRSRNAFAVRWGGKDHYLAKDFATAEQLFFNPDSAHPGCLRRWREWSTAAKAAPPRSRLCRSAPNPRSMTLARAAELMVVDYYDEGRKRTGEAFRVQMTRFLTVHGELRLYDVTTTNAAAGRFQAPIIGLLNAYRADMLALAQTNPKAAISGWTLAHDLKAMKRLIAWCGEKGYCPTLSLKGIRRPPVPPAIPHPITPDRIAKGLLAQSTPAAKRTLATRGDAPTTPSTPTTEPRTFSAATKATGKRKSREVIPDHRLIPWLALNYLLGVRPVELTRIINATCNASGPIARATVNAAARRPGERIAHDDEGRPIAVDAETLLLGTGVLWHPIVDHHDIATGRSTLSTNGGEAEAAGGEKYAPMLLEVVRHKKGASGQRRFVIFTSECLEWLDLARPYWQGVNGYQHACLKAGVGSWPSRCRDSFATHLRGLGIPEADVKTCLGHGRSDVLQSYSRKPWPIHLDQVRRISLRSVLDRIAPGFAASLPPLRGESDRTLARRRRARLSATKK